MSDNFNKNSQLIKFQEGNALIYQRASDGYVNATQMCQSHGKEFKFWYRLSTSKQYIEALHNDLEERSVQKMHLPLIHIINEGQNYLRGTWIHPELAIELAGWLSTAFKIKVNRLILNWMSGNYRVEKVIEKVRYIPDQIKRYLYNEKRTPKGNFSILQEIGAFLIALEGLGCRIHNNKLIDGSVGRHFYTHLESRGINTNDAIVFEKFTHLFGSLNRKDPQIKSIPFEYLAEFKNWFQKVYLKELVFEYGKNNFPESLPYIKKYLQQRNYDVSKFEKYESLQKIKKEIKKLEVLENK